MCDVRHQIFQAAPDFSAPCEAAIDHVGYDFLDALMAFLIHLASLVGASWGCGSVDSRRYECRCHSF